MVDYNNVELHIGDKVLFKVFKTNKFMKAIIWRVDATSNTYTRILLQTVPKECINLTINDINLYVEQYFTYSNEVCKIEDNNLINQTLFMLKV